jgi:hypothetical protein
MNKKELSLSILILFGFFATATVLRSESSYDCQQALFSSSSSCSIDGSSCIKTHEKASIFGLWNFMIGENCPLIITSSGISCSSHKGSEE